MTSKGLRNVPGQWTRKCYMSALFKSILPGLGAYNVSSLKAYPLVLQFCHTMKEYLSAFYLHIVSSSETASSFFIPTPNLYVL